MWMIGGLVVALAAREGSAAAREAQPPVALPAVLARALVGQRRAHADGGAVRAASAGQLRARLYALKDGAVGWATVREGQAAHSLALAPTEEEPPAQASERAPSTPPAPPARGKGKGPQEERQGKGRGGPLRSRSPPAKRPKGKAKGS